MRHAYSRRLLAGVTAALVMCAAITTVPAQVLEQVPADALVVVKVKNLTQTSGKLGKMLTDFGVAAVAPGMDDPLAFLQKKLGVNQGLKTDGELAFVYRDPETSKLPPDKSVMILVPVTDYKAFLSNFAGAKTTGSVTEVRFGAKPAKAGETTKPTDEEDESDGSDHPSFVAQWGNYAAVAPVADAVSAKPAAFIKIPGAATVKELAARDMVLLANMSSLRTRLDPKIQEGKQAILEQVEQGLAGEEKAAKFAPVAKTAVSQLMLIAESFMRDCDGASVGLDFGAEGLKISVMADFQPTSYIGTSVSSITNTSEQLLAGLPSGKYLMFGGASGGNPKMTVKVIDDFSAPIVKDAIALGPEFKSVADYVAALKAYVQTQNGAAFGMVAPAGNLGQEAVIQFTSVNRGDAAAMKAAYQKMMTAQQDVMQAFGLPADSFKATVTPAAKTIDGIAFDKIQTAINPDPNDPSSQQQAQMMAMMYGPEGMTLLMGAISKDVMLMTSGVPDALVSATIAAAKAGDAPMAKLAPVQSVAANLPKNRVAEMYIPVDTIATTVATYAAKFGAGAPDFKLPEDLPPIGLSMSSEGSAVRVDTYVPTSLVQAMVSASMQVMMQMQGGNRGGGGL